MKQNMPGGTSAVVPPDPMPNSEVKRRSADGSVGSPHVRVGNCQASNKKNPVPKGAGFFAFVFLPLPLPETFSPSPCRLDIPIISGYR